MLVPLILMAAAAVGERGLAIALAGILIVGVALSLISLFIAALPRLLEVINKSWPEVDEPHGKQSHPESLVPDNDAVLAAIGFVLHSEFQKQLRQDVTGSSKSLLKKGSDPLETSL